MRTLTQIEQLTRALAELQGVAQSAARWQQRSEKSEREVKALQEALRESHAALDTAQVRRGAPGPAQQRTADACMAA